MDTSQSFPVHAQRRCPWILYTFVQPVQISVCVCYRQAAGCSDLERHREHTPIVTALLLSLSAVSVDSRAAVLIIPATMVSNLLIQFMLSVSLRPSPVLPCLTVLSIRRTTDTLQCQGCYTRPVEHLTLSCKTLHSVHCQGCFYTSCRTLDSLYRQGCLYTSCQTLDTLYCQDCYTHPVEHLTLCIVRVACTRPVEHLTPCIVRPVLLYMSCRTLDTLHCQGCLYTS